MFPILATAHARYLADLGPGLPDVQAWWQTGAVLVCVMAATAWLTARWLIRRKKGCAGDCSRCVAGGAATTPGPGACGHTHGGTGIRSDSLRVVRSGGPP
ncbi:MAG TPA: hypothetical protein VGB85_34035, partial [Nannocystis sp.]